MNSIQFRSDDLKYPLFSAKKVEWVSIFFCEYSKNTFSLQPTCVAYTPQLTHSNSSQRTIAIHFTIGCNTIKTLFESKYWIKIVLVLLCADFKAKISKGYIFEVDNIVLRSMSLNCDELDELHVILNNENKNKNKNLYKATHIGGKKFFWRHLIKGL